MQYITIQISLLSSLTHFCSSDCIYTLSHLILVHYHNLPLLFLLPHHAVGFRFANEINTVDEAKTYYPAFGLVANVALIFSGQYVKVSTPRPISRTYNLKVFHGFFRKSLVDYLIHHFISLIIIIVPSSPTYFE